MSLQNLFTTNNYELNSRGITINTKGVYTQATSITTGVTITNAETAFQITTQGATTATTASTSFTITNSSILATSYILMEVVSYSGTPLTNGIGIWRISAVAAGSCTATIDNFGANALNGTYILRFLII